MSSRSRAAKKSKSLDAKAMSKSKSKGVYCVCKGPDDGRMMIACDACNDWFHVGCIGMTKTAASKLKSFTCAGCSRKQNGDSIITLVKESETKKAKKNKKESKAVASEQVAAPPRRLAKRTRKATTTATAAAAKSTSTSTSTNKRRRKEEEDEEEAENSSGHNESEVEDEADEDGDDEEKKEKEADDNEEDEEAEDNDEEESSYELERKRRMEENQRFLQSLGLLDVKKSLGMTATSGSSSGGTARKYTGKRHRWSAGDADLSKGDDSFEGDEEGSRSAGAQPVRKSRRLQNEPALDFAQIKMEVVQELADRPVVRRARGSIVAHARGFHGNGRVPDTEHIVAPFSLASVATTIWSLGRIYQGDASPEKYHSSKQCMYRHPYPVGYRASTVKWGSVWIMEIHEGRDGPLFVVRQKRDDEHEDGTPIHAAGAQEETNSSKNSNEKKNGKSEEVDGEEEGQESFTFADEEPEEGVEEKKEQEPEPQQEETKEKGKGKEKRAKTFKRFEGPSATQPWTKACIDGPSPGSRISGPLVFGFSDPLTVHILNRLKKKKNNTTTA